MKKSLFRISLSAVLTGLCVACATMGKQYLEALIGAGILLIIFNFKKSVTKKNFDRVLLFAFGTIAAMMPLIIFAVYFKNEYLGIESHYINEFINIVKKDGFDGFMTTYFNRMKDCLFGESYAKWFLPDYPLIPFSYYILLIPGLIIAFFKKHFIFPIVALLASFGALLAGYSDYRVLHSSPFWVITMAFTMSWIFVLLKRLYKKFIHKKLLDTKIPVYRILSICLVAVIALLGILSGAEYIYKKSKDPFSIRHFNQKVVGVSRYIRDIVAGVPNPSTELRSQEFKKLKG
jgi:hypothetical protein